MSRPTESPEYTPSLTEGTDSEELWMITAPSAILVICIFLRECVVFFLLKEAHFIPARYGLGRVGAGRPLLGRTYPPLRTCTCRMSRHTALTFTWILSYSVLGTASAHPTFLFGVLQAPLAPFLPGRSGFKDVTAFYPSVGTTYAFQRSGLRTPLQLHVE